MTIDTHTVVASQKFDLGKITVRKPVWTAVCEATGCPTTARSLIARAMDCHSRGQWGEATPDADAALNEWLLASGRLDGAGGHVLVSRHEARGLLIEIATDQTVLATVVRLAGRPCLRSRSERP